MDFRFPNPQVLFLLLLIIPYVFWMGRRVSGMNRRRKIFAIVLRCIIFALLVLSLAEIHWSRLSDRLTVIYVFDDSDSVPAEKKKQAQEFIRESLNAKPSKDRAGILVFAGDVSMEYSPQSSIQTDQVEFRSVVDRKQTNIASALRLALAAFGENTQKRIVLISDGNETRGYAEEIAREAASHDAVIDVLPLTYRHRNDIVVEKVVLPGQVNFDEPFNLRVFVQSNIDTPAEMTVWQDEQVIVAGQPIQLEGGKKNSFILQTQIPETENARNFHNYRVRVLPTDDAQEDTNTDNNSASGFTWTRGKPRVLLVDGDGQGAEFLAASLTSENINVDYRTIEGIPYNYEEILNYDSIVFSNVPAYALTRTQMQWIENAVHELGIGFIMIGGEKAFGPGGYQDTPVEETLPVSMDIKQKKIIPKGALVLILHTCEFANGNKWARDIARASLDVLSSRDMMGVLYYNYNRGDDWLYQLQEVGDKTRMHKLITTCTPGDMPSFDPTMNMAYKSLQKSGASVKHLVIISDGDPSQPSKNLVNSIQAAKITISTICINPHSPRDTKIMEDLAKWGNGRYYNPTDPRRLPQIFIKEATMTRQALIAEDTFNPKFKMQSEMLTGFEQSDFPPLHGYVRTSIKTLADEPLASHEDDPLLASWHYGVGKAVAFTSDAKNRWAADWMGWERFSKFWSQIVRWSMRSIVSGNYQMQTTIEDGIGKVVIDALNPDETRNFEMTLIKPDLSREPLNVRQTAAGRYEASFDADQIGTFLVRAQPEGTEQILTGGISMSYSPEYQSWQSNEALLTSLAEESDGRILSQEANVFDHSNLEPARQSEPLWPLAMALALLLIPLDIFIRRVLMDWEMFKDLMARAWNFLGLNNLIFWRRHKTSDETVEALLGVKERLRTRERARRGREETREAEPETPAADKEERLAQLDRVEQKSDVLKSTTGADKIETPQKPKKKKDDAGEEKPETGMGRLMEAKKRARRRKK